jgi:hypothetical protein
MPQSESEWSEPYIAADTIAADDPYIAAEMLPVMLDMMIRLSVGVRM